MMSRLPVLLLIGTSFIIFLLYLMIPNNASEEYRYTIKILYELILPTELVIFYFLYYKICNVVIYKLINYIKCLPNLAINYINSHLKYILFSFAAGLFLLVAAILWFYSISLLIGAFFSLLPYLCLLGTIWLFRLYNQKESFFISLVKSSLLWSSIVWLETNALSWLDLINENFIAIFWGIYSIPIFFLLLRERKAWGLPKLRKGDWIPIFIAFFTLLIALLYPPNNFDVLTYHMPRVEQWLQNGSLAPYFTPSGRQIGMAPFNAYIVLQSFAPARMDYFVNLGQWLSYIGCMIAVRQIAISLCASKRAQNASVIFAATLPSAIIQASNTESSLLVSYFLCAMAWLAIRCWREKNITIQQGLLFGLALGFAILSKGSAYPIAFPFVVIVAWLCIITSKKAFLHGVLAACLVVVINVPHVYRTYVGTGSIVGGAEGNILKQPSIQTFVVNALYNFVVNHPKLLSNGGAETLDSFAAKLGVYKEDKSIFPWGTFEHSLREYSFYEGYSPNPVHSLFMIFIIAGIAFRRFKAPPVYTCAVFMSFILFILLLTFHTWVGRIQVSLFLLASPIAGLYIASLRSQRLQNFVLYSLCFVAIFPLFMCMERPLVSKAIFFPEADKRGHFLSSSREKLLFNVWPEIAADYIAATEFISSKKPADVGVMLGVDGFEYPFWRILQDRLGKDRPKIVAIVPPPNNAPRYVFDFERDWQEMPKHGPRILKYENGEATVIFESGSEKH